MRECHWHHANLRENVRRLAGWVVLQMVENDARRKMLWLRLATFAVRETDAGAVGVTTRGGRARRRRGHYG